MRSLRGISDADLYREMSREGYHGPAWAELECRAMHERAAAAAKHANLPNRVDKLEDQLDRIEGMLKRLLGYHEA